ncbi:MAG: hypothetical protein WBL61_08950, partial [Bryobacteraceae bacterium]
LAIVKGFTSATRRLDRRNLSDPREKTPGCHSAVMGLRQRTCRARLRDASCVHKVAARLGHGQRMTDTAKALGLERSHLYKKCQALGIDLRALRRVEP